MARTPGRRRLICLMLLLPAVALAEPRRDRTPRDTAGLGGRPRTIPLQLGPPDESAPSLRKHVEPGRVVTLGNWQYWAEKNPERGDSVPWLLRARPIGPKAGEFQSPGSFNPALRVADAPVVRIPQSLWNAWFPPDLHDVVGIHYHEFVYGDLARILITVHKVPPDLPDGTPTEAVATRLEATLLTPLTYSLDQTLMVRADRNNEAAIASRLDHERGHAEQSLHALLAVLAGPNDWDPQRNRGRRSTLEWFWRTRKVYRRWDDYRAGKAESAALRTSITLVPPTRWSKLLPVPPDKLNPREIQRFNDEIVHLDKRFNVVDQAHQDRFHGQHGAFEQANGR